MLSCWYPCLACMHVPRVLSDTYTISHAGLRIDPQLNASSRMSHYTGLSLAQMTDSLVLPAPLEATLPITGFPQGMWINLVSWAQDGRHIAFTVRSPGEAGGSVTALLMLLMRTCVHAWQAVSSVAGRSRGPSQAAPGALGGGHSHRAGALPAAVATHGPQHRL